MRESSRFLQFFREQTIYFSVFTGISFLILGLLVFYLGFTYRQTESSAITTVSNQAHVLTSRLDSTLRRVQAISDMVTENIDIHTLSGLSTTGEKARINKWLNAIGRDFPETLGHVVFDADGKLVYGSNPAFQNIRVDDRTYFQEAKAAPVKGIYFSDTLLAKTTNSPSVIAYQSILGNDGSFRGLIATPIHLDFFVELFSKLNIGDHGSISIRRSDTSKLVVRWPEDMAKLNREAYEFPPQRKIEAGSESGVVRYISATEGAERILAYHVVPKFPYYVLVSLSVDEQFADWWRVSVISVFLTLLSLFLIGYFLFFFQRSEALLKKSEQRHKAIVENQQDAICRWLPDTTLTFANQKYAEYVRRDKQHLPGHKWLEFIPEDEHGEILEYYDRVAELRKASSREYTYRLAGENHLYLQWTDTPILDSEGNCVEFQSIGRDITERKLAEIALSESEHRLRTITDTVNDAILMIDNDGNITFWNPAAERIFGYTHEDALGQNLHRLLLPTRYLERYEQAFNHFKTSGTGRALNSTLELAALHKNGQEIVIELSISSLKIQGSWHAVGIVRDISKRKAEEMVLKESEARFKALHDASFGGIVIHDYSRILECNHGLSELTGYLREELLGMDPFALIAPAWLEIVRRNDASGFDQSYEAEGIRKDGSIFPLNIRSKTMPYKNEEVRVTEYRDNTDQKRVEKEKDLLQRQLIQAQKIEAIGTLAGGIAHDFNNILGAVIGYAEMARDASEPGSEIGDYLDRVLEASQRASSLVNQILAFSRQADTQKIILDPIHIIKEVVKLLRASLPATITITVDYGEDSGAVFADPTQFHQVILNICTNAFHAMERTGGSLTVNVSCCEVDRDQLQNFPTVLPGKFVRVVIADTGTGIPQELLAKIYEPYFTTKNIGDGTGLGLSIVHGIVNTSGGFITCESVVGKGTSFALYFPYHDKKVSMDISNDQVCASGSEHILFVDDEAILVELGKEMFERLGYTVTVRTSSLEALTTFQNQPDLFDLVITDQTMPGMTGLELGRHMLMLRPDLPIILCTGFSKMVDERLAKANGIKAFAYKPLAKHKMAALIRSVLDPVQ